VTTRRVPGGAACPVFRPAGSGTPVRGPVTAPGRLGCLRQDLALGTALAADGPLGVAPARRALHAIERGDSAEPRDRSYRGNYLE